MTLAASRADILKPLNVLSDLTTQFALDYILLGERTDLLLLLAREFASFLKSADAGGFQDCAGARFTDAEDERQRIRELLIIGNGNAGDTHSIEISPGAPYDADSSC